MSTPFFIMQQGLCGIVLNSIFIRLDLKCFYHNQGNFLNLYNTYKGVIFSFFPYIL